MAALVGADGNTLGILLQGCRNHFIDRTVVAQVNDLSAHALQNTAHDIDGGVVAIKQTGGRDKSDFVGRTVFGERFEFG
jgi:hypothetical protein